MVINPDIPNMEKYIDKIMEKDNAVAECNDNVILYMANAIEAKNEIIFLASMAGTATYAVEEMTKEINALTNEVNDLRSFIDKNALKT